MRIRDPPPLPSPRQDRGEEIDRKFSFRKMAFKGISRQGLIDVAMIASAYTTYYCTALFHVARAMRRDPRQKVRKILHLEIYANLHKTSSDL